VDISLHVNPLLAIICLHKPPKTTLTYTFEDPLVTHQGYCWLLRTDPTQLHHWSDCCRCSVVGFVGVHVGVGVRFGGVGCGLCACGSVSSTVGAWPAPTPPPCLCCSRLCRFGLVVCRVSLLARTSGPMAPACSAALLLRTVVLWSVSSLRTHACARCDRRLRTLLRAHTHGFGV